MTIRKIVIISITIVLVFLVTQISAWFMNQGTFGFYFGLFLLLSAPASMGYVAAKMVAKKENT